MTEAELTGNEAAMKMTKAAGREIGIIKPEIYGDGVVNKEDIYTLASVVGVGVNKSMDEDTAYKLTKLFWEGVEKNKTTQPWLASFNMDYAVQDGGMSLHPGALKYYRERGIEIPTGSK